MKNNSGVTIVNMLIIIIVIVILSGLTIGGGMQILKSSKNSQKEENLSAVKAAVNNISTKLNTAGVLTPANVKLYGSNASSILSGDSDLENWYILGKADLEEMGISYLNEDYLVNYKENQVMLMSDYTGKLYARKDTYYTDVLSPIIDEFAGDELNDREEKLKDIASRNSKSIIKPIPTIDFVQPFLFSDYSEEDYYEYVRKLKEAGYEEIIFQFVMDIEGGIDNTPVVVKSSWYDSKFVTNPSSLETYKPDVLDNLMKAAEMYNIKIWIGLPSTNDWWKDAYKDEGWRKANSDFTNEVLVELYEKYKSYSCLTGWYSAQEMYTNPNDNNLYWAELLNENIAQINELNNGDNNYRFMISPFISQVYPMSQEQVYNQWKEIVDNTNFRDRDFICFQDGLGTIPWEPDEIMNYIIPLHDAIKSSDKNVYFGLNVENYDSTLGTSAQLSRFLYQVQIASQYSDLMVSFSYSHYYQNHPELHQKYCEYYKQINAL